MSHSLDATSKSYPGEEQYELVGSAHARGGVTGNERALQRQSS
jgi:hypothetical protein